MSAEARGHRRRDRPPVLGIAGLTIEFATRRGAARVVDDVTLDVWPQ